MERVYTELGSTEEEQVARFFQGYEASQWLEDHQKCAWIPSLLAHLYGPTKGAAYALQAEQRATTGS